MPSLNWRQDKDRVGPSGKKQGLGLEMLSGTLAARIVIHFRPRSAEEENELQVKPSPNSGRPFEPNWKRSPNWSCEMQIAHAPGMIRDSPKTPTSPVSVASTRAPPTPSSAARSGLIS